MVVLLPRLPAPVAESALQRFLEQGHEKWAGFDPRRLPDGVRFAATGGSRISDQQLMHLRNSLEVLARKHGFGSGGIHDTSAKFDAEASAWLSQEPLLDSGEALRDDVWSFVGVVLAPDMVQWRFGNSPRRYVGGVRNTFQRLWIRGRAFDRGPQHPERWKLLEQITEDALVQITERPSIGGDPVLALAIGEAWLRSFRLHGRSGMEDVMRRAILRIRIRNEIRNLAELAPGYLRFVLDEIFQMSRQAMAATSMGSAQPLEGGEYLEHGPSTNRLGLVDGQADEGQAGGLSAAARRIRFEAELRRRLSPGSRVALDQIEAGMWKLEPGDLEALESLLRQLSDSQVLGEEINLLKGAVLKRSYMEGSEEPEPPTPRKRRWAIWRAR